MEKDNVENRRGTLLFRAYIGFLQPSSPHTWRYHIRCIYTCCSTGYVNQVWLPLTSLQSITFNQIIKDVESSSHSPLNNIKIQKLSSSIADNVSDHHNTWPFYQKSCLCSQCIYIIKKNSTTNYLVCLKRQKKQKQKNLQPHPKATQKDKQTNTQKYNWKQKVLKR